MKCMNSVGKYISILYRYSQTYMDNNLKKYNIGSGQYIFLVALSWEDGITQEMLSERLNIDKGTTARAIKILEREEYIKRQVDQNDKRANRIYLTPKALRVKDDIFKILRSWTDLLCKDFNEEEKQNAISYMEKMANNVSNSIK